MDATEMYWAKQAAEQTTRRAAANVAPEARHLNSATSQLFSK